MTNRCYWCIGDDLYERYHDTEWGKLTLDDEYLFAMLNLEAMQAGLSWITILKKRENYYHAFDNFNAKLIANYDDNKVNELIQNAGIIRHRGKILAIIHNAKAYLAITENQSFKEYICTILGRQTPLINHPKTPSDIPAFSDESERLAKQLKKDGFKFVGKTTCYAFLQAVGLVNDHFVECDFV